MAEGLDLRAGPARELVKEALRSGFPISCATCEHLHRAWSKQEEQCGKALTCGGPVFGRTYPDYKGPLDEQTFSKLCLICGSADIRFHIVVRRRPFGLCNAHRKALDSVSAPGAIKPLIVAVPGTLDVR